MEFGKEFVAVTLEAMGSVFIAFTALSVHHRFLKEKQVDDKVLKTMKFEQGIGILGVLMIITGYLIQVI